MQDLRGGGEGEGRGRVGGCVGVANEGAEGEVGGHHLPEGVVGFLLGHCHTIQSLEAFQPTQHMAAK